MAYGLAIAQLNTPCFRSNRTKMTADSSNLGQSIINRELVGPSQALPYAA
jgi:hypothetical protein